MYPDFAAFCSSGISLCITYSAPLHTSKDPLPCTPSSSELLPMPPFAAWFSVCPDMPQLVRHIVSKSNWCGFWKTMPDSLSARPNWHSSKANFAFSACLVKSSPRQRATGTMNHHHRHHDMLTRPCSAAIDRPVIFKDNIIHSNLQTWCIKLDS